jgi:hypothetical protein
VCMMVFVDFFSSTVGRCRWMRGGWSGIPTAMAAIC